MTNCKKIISLLSILVLVLMTNNVKADSCGVENLDGEASNAKYSDSIQCLDSLGKLNLQFFQDYEKYTKLIKTDLDALINEESNCKLLEIRSNYNSDFDNLRRECGAGLTDRLRRFALLSKDYAILKKQYKNLKSYNTAIKLEITILERKMKEYKGLTDS